MWMALKAGHMAVFEMKSFRLLECYIFILSLYFAIAISVVKVLGILGSRPFRLEIVWVKCGRSPPPSLLSYLPVKRPKALSNLDYNDKHYHARIHFLSRHY